MSSPQVSRGSRADERERAGFRTGWGLLNHWSANEVAHTGKVTTATSHGCLPEQEVDSRGEVGVTGKGAGGV